MLSTQTLSLALIVFGPVEPALLPTLPAQTESAQPTERAEPAERTPSEGGATSPASEAEADAGKAAPSAAAGKAEVDAGKAAPSAAAVEDGSDASVVAPINPRPQGEEELLGKHPIEPSKGTYKPGTGAIIESKDGLFSMGIRARVQIREELYSYAETTDDGSGGTLTTNHLENTFGIRRARFQLKGHVFGEHNKYKAEFAFSPSDLGYKDGTITRTPLLSYYVEFDYLRDLSVRLGQYKLYYNRQRVVSSGDLELVDRTLAQNEYNLDRDVGFHFFSEDLAGLGFLKYYAGISVGEGRDIWLAEDIHERQNAGAQYLARVEVLPFGDFKDYSEVDFERLNEFRLSVALAYAFLDNGYRTRGYQGSSFADGGRVDYHNLHSDIFFKWAGLTGLAEFYLRNGRRDTTVADGDGSNLPHNGMGGSFQLGYLLPKLPIGVAARYSGIGTGNFDPERTALPTLHEAGGGLSWYIAGHPLKLQADFFHFWGDSLPNGADRFRVQLQVAY